MTAPTPSPEEPRIVVRPQYVRLGAVLIALETSKSLREALRAVHDLKAEQFDDAALTAPLREEVERLREALRDLLQHVPDSLPHGNASKWVLDHAAVTAARALAEGDGNPSQML